MSRSQLDSMLDESGFDPDEAAGMAEVLLPLHQLAEEVPAPSTELLALFGEAEPDTSADAPAPVQVLSALPRDRVRGAIASALVLAVAGVGATGLSAAANTLPSPWQHQVSDFSHHYLPFNFPKPPPPVRTKSLSAPGPQRHVEPIEPERSIAARADRGEAPSRSLAGGPTRTDAAPAARGKAGPGVRHQAVTTSTTQDPASEPATVDRAPQRTPQVAPASPAPSPTPPPKEQRPQGGTLQASVKPSKHDRKPERERGRDTGAVPPALAGPEDREGKHRLDDGDEPGTQRERRHLGAPDEIDVHEPAVDVPQQDETDLLTGSEGDAPRT